MIFFIFSIYVRQKYWNRENFIARIFDEFNTVWDGMCRTIFKYYWKMSLCLCNTKYACVQELMQGISTNCIVFFKPFSEMFRFFFIILFERANIYDNIYVLILFRRLIDNKLWSI